MRRVVAAQHSARQRRCGFDAHPNQFRSCVLRGHIGPVTVANAVIDMVLSVRRPNRPKKPQILLHERGAKAFAVLAWRSHRDRVDARHGRFEDGKTRINSN
jgi:hypothetical protein